MPLMYGHMSKSIVTVQPLTTTGWASLHAPPNYVYNYVVYVYSTIMPSSNHPHIYTTVCFFPHQCDVALGALSLTSYSIATPDKVCVCGRVGHLNCRL